MYREFLRERTRPLRDLSLCRLERSGRVVGSVLSIRNPVPTWWGEGDEKLRIDGETVPSWAGTGTEDYFGGGWAKGERYSHPFHGQPSGDGALQPGLATLARWHVPDPIPFSQSLAFDLELWHHEDVVVDLATTVFFYGARARSPFPEGKVPGFPE